jgi:predicted N-acyltransferase
MTGGEGLPAGTLDRVFAALEGAGDRGGARAVVWPFVDAARGDLIAAARERGYAVVYSGAAAWLPVRWATFEEYLGSRSKSVRRTVRADLRALAAASVRTEAVSDFGGAAGDMDRLYRDAFLRRNGRPAPTPDDLFTRLATAAPAGRERVAQLAWQGDRLVGMSLNLLGADVLDGALAAFAADHAGGPVYYDDLCYHPLRLAFAHGIAALDMGASALYAKVLRGAVVRRRVTLVRGRSRGVHAALAALGAVIARRVESKERQALGALWRPAIAAGEER